MAGPRAISCPLLRGTAEHAARLAVVRGDRSGLGGREVRKGRIFVAALAVAFAAMGVLTPSDAAAELMVPTCDHEFRYVEGSLTWSQAVRRAARGGGHLATADSDDEAICILNVMAANLGSGQAAWLGASDLRSEGRWNWISAGRAGGVLPVDAWAWLGSQPDNWYGQSPQGENCLEGWNAWWDFGWNDRWCGQRQGFIWESNR